MCFCFSIGGSLMWPWIICSENYCFVYLSDHSEEINPAGIPVCSKSQLLCTQLSSGFVHLLDHGSQSHDHHMYDIRTWVLWMTLWRFGSWTWEKLATASFSDRGDIVSVWNSSEGWLKKCYTAKKASLWGKLSRPDRFFSLAFRFLERQQKFTANIIATDHFCFFVVLFYLCKQMF